MKAQVALIAALSCSVDARAAVDPHVKRKADGLGLKPALGWNSWVRNSLYLGSAAYLN